MISRRSLLRRTAPRALRGDELAGWFVDAALYDAIRAALGPDMMHVIADDAFRRRQIAERAA